MQSLLGRDRTSWPRTVKVVATILLCRDDLVLKNLVPYRAPKHGKCLNCIEADLKGMKHSKEYSVTLV